MIPLRRFLATIRYFCREKKRISYKVYCELVGIKMELVALDRNSSEKPIKPFYLIEKYKAELFMIMRRAYGDEWKTRWNEIYPQTREELSLIDAEGNVTTFEDVPKFRQELRFLDEIIDLLNAINLIIKEYLIFETYRDIDVETKTKVGAKLKGLGAEIGAERETHKKASGV